MRSQVRAGLVDDDREFSAVPLPKSIGAARTSSLPRNHRVDPAILAGITLLGAPIVVAGVAARLFVPGHSLFVGGDSGTAGGVFTMLLVGVLVAGSLSLYSLRNRGPK